MKTIITCLIFFFLFTGKFVAQVPPGKWCHRGECITIDTGNTFSYNYNCKDAKALKGQGIIVKKNDTLFHDFNPTYSMYYNLDYNARKVPGGDSLSYLVSLFAMPPPGNNLLFYIPKDSAMVISLCDSLGKTIKNFDRNTYGGLNINITKAEAAGTYLHIAGKGFNEEWIPMKEFTQQQPDARIFLTRGNSTIPPWENHTYKISRISKNKMTLIRIDKTPGAKRTKRKYVYRKQ